MLHERGFGADFLLFLIYFFFPLFLLLPLALKFPLERQEIKGARVGAVAGGTELCPGGSPPTPAERRGSPCVPPPSVGLT